MRPGWFAAALLLLSLVFVAGAGPASAQLAGPDFMVTMLSIAGPVPGWVDGVRNSTTIQATVANHGSAPATFEIDYSWLDEHGVLWTLNENGQSSVDFSDAPLAPGESVTLTAPWRLQPWQAGAGRLHARAIVIDFNGQAPADEDPSNNVRTTPVFVPVHSTTFTIDEVPAEAPPDGAGFFRMSVRNDGNMPEPVTLAIVGAPNDARLRAEIDPASPAVLTVPPGSTAHPVLYVRYVPEGDFTPFAVRYTVEARPQTGAAHRASTPLLTNGSEEAGVEGFGFSVSGEPTNVVPVPAGGQALVPFVVANVGTRPDNYTINTFESGTSEGWTVEPVPRRVALLPGEAAPVQLRLVAPPNAPPGTLHEVKVIVRGSLLPDGRSIAIEALVPGPSLVLTNLRLDPPVAYAGEEQSVVVTVANQGDSTAPSGSVLRLRHTFPGVSPPLLEQQLPALAMGEALDRSFRLGSLPAGGLATLVVEMEGTGASSTAQLQRTVLVHAPLLGLLGPVPLAGGPGEDVAYRLAPSSFRVVNVGNALEEVAVEAQADAGEATVEGPATFRLSPGEARTLAIRHTLPRPIADRTEDNLTVTVRVVGHGASWSLTVATGLRDLDPPTLTADLPERWSFGIPLPFDVVATDDNVVAAVQATVTDPAGTVTNLTLADRGDGHWTGSIDAPMEGESTVNFTAWDPAGHRASTPSWRVQVTRIPPPQLSLPEVLAGQAIDPAARLRLVVEDAEEIASAVLEIRQGNATVIRELNVTDGVAEFDLGGITAGPATLALRVTNNAGAMSALTLDVEVLAPASNADPTPQATKDAGAPTWAAAVATLALALRRPAGRRGEDLP